MDFDRWYRKTERRASARMWQGVVVAFVGMMLSGLLAKIGNEAGTALSRKRIKASPARADGAVRALRPCSISP